MEAEEQASELQKISEQSQELNDSQESMKEASEVQKKNILDEEWKDFNLSPIILKHAQTAAGNDSKEVEGLYQKKKHLDLDLVQAGSKQLDKDKVSNKMTRREYQFFSQYILQKRQDEINEMKNTYPFEIDAQQYYKDIHGGGFERLLNDDKDELLIKQYGDSISVKLTFTEDGKINREVKEDPSLINETKDESLAVESGMDLTNPDKIDSEQASKDSSLMQLDLQFKSLSKEFNKTA